MQWKHNTILTILSLYIYLIVCVCTECIKQYDMSVGSYLEKVYKTDHMFWSSRASKRRLKTLKKTINQHDNSITKLNCNLWPERTQGNVLYVLRLSRWCVLNVQEWYMRYSMKSGNAEKEISSRKRTDVKLRGVWIDGEIQGTGQKVKDWKWVKNKFLFWKNNQFTKTPSSIRCGGLYYTVDPLNISLYSILFWFINVSGSVLSSNNPEGK